LFLVILSSIIAAIACIKKGIHLATDVRHH
jgi:hypothetical protein